MHWEILIIPLIAVGVWILGTLFRSEDDKLKKGVGRRKASGLAARQRVATVLDHILEEARRRREPDDRLKVPRPPTRAPARPLVRERPPQRRAGSVSEGTSAVAYASGSSTTRRVAPATAKTEVVVALPVAEPVPTAPPVREVPPTLPPPPPAAVRSAPVVLQQVRSLLSKPQTAATAVVLREIFDRPLCQRRRNHPYGYPQ